jgi:molybdate transport system substrate-binding protein
LSDVVAAFQAYYANFGANYAYNVVVTANSPQGLEADVIAGNGAGPYDIIISSDKKVPHQLATNYPSLVVGTPFKYAEDFLLLYSETVDISSGLPYPFTTNFVIPDPTQTNYGKASAEVLSSYPWYVDPATIPSGYIFTAPSAGISYGSIDAGTYAYGFIAKSTVCRLFGGSEIYSSPSYYREYKPDNANHPYDKLVLKGIELANSTRTGLQPTEISDFIAFLTGGTDSLGNTPTNGVNLLQSYCLKTP